MQDLLRDLKVLRRELDSSVGVESVAVQPRRPIAIRYALAILAFMLVLVAAVVIYRFPFRGSPKIPRPEIKSLAILPLENISGDPAQDYFADGMTEALINDLAQVGALRVISRTSVMRASKENSQEEKSRVSGRDAPDHYVLALCISRL